MQDAAPPAPGNALSLEAQRVADLHSYEILDTPAQPQFDRIVNMASTLLKMPISLVTLIDSTRQWFKAQHGIGGCETAREHAMCDHTIRHDDVMVVEDATLDPRFADNPYVLGAPNVRFYAGAPLKTPQGFNLGSLCVIDNEPRHFSEADKKLLRDLAAIVVDELELHRRNIDLQRLAETDPLTGAANRRRFFTRAAKEVARSQRYGPPLSVLMIDIDHFKKINDTYGHDIGDKALVATVERLTSSLRPEATLGRLGGEEFAVLLPEADGPAAAAAGERLREAVSRIEIEEDGKVIRFTVSIGICALQPGLTLEDVMNRSDQALYQAKQSGRNRVVVAD
jgi:diguanylate cyclase (GGDEF)-like protein